MACWASCRLGHLDIAAFSDASDSGDDDDDADDEDRAAAPVGIRLRNACRHLPAAEAWHDVVPSSEHRSALHADALALMKLLPTVMSPWLSQQRWEHGSHFQSAARACAAPTGLTRKSAHWRGK